MSKTRGTKWDGKSRVSNDLYRKRYNEIFRDKSKDDVKHGHVKQEPCKQKDKNI
jgi:hypothetical protein|tara:strand:+ start:218 stop:379 length:162 start_codon:yes stop_codon:yes gene_type:complete